MSRVDRGDAVSPMSVGVPKADSSCFPVDVKPLRGSPIRRIDLAWTTSPAGPVASDRPRTELGEQHPAGSAECAPNLVCGVERFRFVALDCAVAVQFGVGACGATDAAGSGVMDAFDCDFQCDVHRT